MNKDVFGCLKVSGILEGKSLTVFGLATSKSGKCIHFEHHLNSKNGTKAIEFTSSELGKNSEVLGVFKNLIFTKKNNRKFRVYEAREGSLKPKLTNKI